MLYIEYPKCSTCKKIKDHLIEKGENFETRDIKLQNPTATEIKNWHKLSGLDIKKFFNTSGLVYKDLGLKDKLPLMTDEEKYTLLATDGMLVKRPILIDDDKVYIARDILKL